MKVQIYVEKLHNSPEYKEFKEKYKDSFLVAGFFILDFETKQNIHQIDYYVPSQKKVAAFSLDEKINVQLLETLSDEIPKELDMNTNVDLDALRGILEDEMKNRNMTEDIKKIIAVIQIMEGKKTWILNCVLSGMEILKAHIEDESKTVLKMEKSSVLDYIKRIPAPPADLAEPSEGAGGDRLEQLEKLKQALEKEKERLEKKKELEDKDPQSHNNPESPENQPR